MNHYVDFKTNFVLEVVKDDAKIYIAVDTEYVVFINGEFVDMGAYDDFPNNKSYDVLNISKYLIKGENELFIIGYAQGIGSFQYIKGTPFIMFSLVNGDFVLNSNDKILCRENPYYKSDEVELISMQMAYTFEYDASNEETEWNNATLVDPQTVSKKFYERPIKKCVFETKSTSIIKAQGTLIRRGNEAAKVSEHIQSDYMSTVFPSKFFQIKNPAYMQNLENNFVLWTGWQDFIY